MGTIRFVHQPSHCSACDCNVLEPGPGELLGSYIGPAAKATAVHPKDWQSCRFHIKNKAKEVGQELALLQGGAAEPAAREFCEQTQDLVHTACQTHRRLAQGSWRAKAAKEKELELRRTLRQICRQPLDHAKTESFRQRLPGKEQKHLFTKDAEQAQAALYRNTAKGRSRPHPTCEKKPPP